MAKVFLIVMIFFVNAHAQDTNIKVSQACEIDLNNDGNADTAFVLQSPQGQELSVILRNKNKVEGYVLSTSVSNRTLVCKKAQDLQETKSGKSKGKFHKVPGAYVELTQPESSATAYYWNGKKFVEVWTA